MFRFNNLLIKVDKAAKKKLSDVFSDSNKTQNELLERSSHMAGSTETSRNPLGANSIRAPWVVLILIAQVNSPIYLGKQ